MNYRKFWGGGNVLYMYVSFYTDANFESGEDAVCRFQLICDVQYIELNKPNTKYMIFWKFWEKYYTCTCEIRYTILLLGGG